MLNIFVVSFHDNFGLGCKVRTIVDRLLENINSGHWSDRTSERQTLSAISSHVNYFGKHRSCREAHVQAWKCSERLQKIGTKLEKRWTFHARLFGALQSMIFDWKSTSDCQGYCHSIGGATFFEVVSNELRDGVKYKNVDLRQIWCRADIVNISEFASRKTRSSRVSLTYPIAQQIYDHVNFKNISANNYNHNQQPKIRILGLAI